MSLGRVWWAPFVLGILPQKHQVFTFWTDSGTLCFTHGYFLLILEEPSKCIGLSQLKKGRAYLMNKWLLRCLTALPQTKNSIRPQLWSSPSVPWSSSTCMMKSIHLGLHFQDWLSSSITNKFRQMAKPLKPRGLKSSRRNSFLQIRP